MREGWEIKTIGEVCEIYQPTTLSTKELDESGRYYVYGANGIIGRYSKYNHEESEVILTCRGSTCGNINVSLPFSWINGNAMVVRPKDKTLLKEYLKYLLRGIDYSKVITGAAQPQITRIKLAPSVISFPKSIPEQQRIVDILDREFAKIDALKANAEKSLQAAKDLFQATLKKELEPKEGWIQYELGTIADFKNGLNFGKEVGNCRFHFLGVGDFKDNLSVDVNTLGQILKDEIDDDYLLHNNDIVFVRSNGSKQLVGRCLLVKNAVKKATFSGFCIRCRLKGAVLLPQYLIHFCTMDETKKYLTSSGEGCNISNLNQKVLSSLKIRAPKSKDEQARIVETIEQQSTNTKVLQENYQKTLTLCDDLKQSLLRKAFNGEL